jgi:branched-chain amino acid aminotransferase
VYIAAEPLHVPPERAYAEGVKTITVEMQRQTPKAKLTRFIERSGSVRQALPQDVNEAIMVNAQGQVLEGLTSNFFGVLDGVLWTAEEGVLSGITRSLTLECAARLGIPVTLQALHKGQIPILKEAFITSSSRAVLPVRQIDDCRFTAPGPLTHQLMDAYNQAIEREVDWI